MKLTIHSIHFNADQKLIDFVQVKVDKLEKIFDRIVDGEVFLKVNNSSVTNKTVEIKINIPGDQLFAKERSKSFEAGTEEAVEGLRRQLKKHKEKLISK